MIGILAAMMMANFAGARERARDARRKSDFEQMKTALRLYYNDHQEGYPANGGTGGGQIVGCGTSATKTVCAWVGSFAMDGTVYMKYLPLDPLNNGNYVYTYAQTDGGGGVMGDGFSLTTYLENGADQDAAKSQRMCGVAAGAETPNRYMACE